MTIRASPNEGASLVGSATLTPVARRRLAGRERPVARTLAVRESVLVLPGEKAPAPIATTTGIMAILGVKWPGIGRVHRFGRAIRISSR
jgi:hypothetical protein